MDFRLQCRKELIIVRTIVTRVLQVEGKPLLVTNLQMLFINEG